MRKNKRVALTPMVYGTEAFGLNQTQGTGLHINKRKIFGWAASALALVAVPTGAFAWSVNSTRFPTPASNQSKPVSNVSHASADTTNDSASNTTVSNNSQPVTTPDPSKNDSVNMSGNAQNHSTTQVTVNGQSISVPTNGTTKQTVTSDGQPVNVSIQHQSSTSTTGTGTNNSTTNLQINSSSTNNVNSDTPE